MNKDKLKEARKIVADHQKHERFVQGDWLIVDSFKGTIRGCFYGCTMQTKHKPIETFCETYDMPLWIGYWSESVFEGLPETEYTAWPLQLLDALIAFEGDIEIVKHKLAVKRLSYLSKHNEGEVKKAIDGVIECHENFIKGEKNVSWLASHSAAQSACSAKSQSAAWSAWSASESAYSAAQPVTKSESASRSAWSAAESESARSAARSAAESGSTRSAAWQRERDWMLEILRGVITC